MIQQDKDDYLMHVIVYKALSQLNISFAWKLSNCHIKEINYVDGYMPVFILHFDVSFFF